jgi:hypothetical protein
VDVLQTLPHDAEWLPSMAQAAEIAAAVGDRQTANVLDGLMAPFDQRVVVEGIGAAVRGTLGGFRAPLVALLGRSAEAEQLAADAAAAAEAMGLRDVPAIVESRPPDLPGSRPAPADAIGRPGEFRRDGEVWVVSFAGTSALVRHTKGMQDLAVLLAHANASVHVSELMAATTTRMPALSRGTATHDRTALSEYRRRLTELDDDIAEAEAHNDPGRLAMLQGERDFLLVELSGAVGLGGRVRRSGDDIDRMRKAVRARLRDAIMHIEAVHPALGRHLTASVRTGVYCAYQPEYSVGWTVA